LKTNCKTTLIRCKNFFTKRPQKNVYDFGVQLANLNSGYEALITKSFFKTNFLINYKLGVLFFSLFIFSSFNNVINANFSKDSTAFYLEAESPTVESDLPAKVIHAEPIYIDLIRDLGARKGEKEWNLGVEATRFRKYNYFHTLIEYEWAPIDRLGLEIELPFSFYQVNGEINENSPRSNLNSLQLAAQYTFLVSEKAQTSLALGYLHEFALTEFVNYGKEPLYTGNVYSPFFVAAKRWGRNWHSINYSGPVIFQDFNGNPEQNFWQFNTSIQYMPKGRNYIGVEVNKELEGTDFYTVLRPSIRIEFNDQLLLGALVSVPVNNPYRGLGTFLRLVYEPAEHHYPKKEKKRLKGLRK
jgi:hypothetical protein